MFTHLIRSVIFCSPYSHNEKEKFITMESEVRCSISKKLIGTSYCRWTIWNIYKNDSFNSHCLFGVTVPKRKHVYDGQKNRRGQLLAYITIMTNKWPLWSLPSNLAPRISHLPAPQSERGELCRSVNIFYTIWFRKFWHLCRIVNICYMHGIQSLWYSDDRPPVVSRFKNVEGWCCHVFVPCHFFSLISRVPLPVC